jgi:hypothetical protein
VGTTKSGKLVATDVGARFACICGPFLVEAKYRTQFSETARNIKRRLRVKNAGCNEDIAVESSEF